MGRTQRAEETWFSAVVERRLADLRGRKGREEEELRDVSDGDGDETGEIAPKSGARSEYPHDEEDVWLPYRTYLSTFL